MKEKKRITDDSGMDNLTDYDANVPSSDESLTCTDRDGREILNGFLYTPG